MSIRRNQSVLSNIKYLVSPVQKTEVSQNSELSHLAKTVSLADMLA